MGKLNDLRARKATGPNKLGDGEGLWLKITAKGTKSWYFRFKGREMGLGAYPLISLAEARHKATEARKLVASGIDPIAAREVNCIPQRPVTFDQATEQWVDAFKSGWRSARTPKIRLARLKRFASPVMGARDVRDIETADVLKVLSPIWAVKTETADSVRQYLESVFEFAAAMGYRDRNQPNPAMWRNNLRALLPARSKVHRVKHHPAMPYLQMPSFMVELRGETALSARALELTILTACRSGDVLLAPRNEISGDLWIIPESRMKAGREHRVPLVPQALKIIEELPVIRGNPYLFPGHRKGRPLSNMSMEMLMRRLGYTKVTVHGFRSSFRDWAAECTSIPREIAEMCLAHQVGSEVERSYRRSDLIARRRELLTLWQDFLLSQI